MFYDVDYEKGGIQGSRPFSCLVNILVLRQAQDEDEKSAGPSLFLMLSLSKHEEAATGCPPSRGQQSRCALTRPLPRHCEAHRAEAI